MKTIIIFNYSLYELILYFFIYAFLGWISEVIFATLKTGKFVNRGFLNGPLCPIYGHGMLIAILLLQNVRDKWYLLFIVGALVCTLLELITGFVLEKLFHTKWWDYSKEPFNIKGYVCLRFSILWGIGIVLMFYTIVPLFEKIVSSIPEKLGVLLIILMIIVFITDNILTLLALLKYNKKIKEIDELSQLIRKGSDAIGEVISHSTTVITNKVDEIKEKNNIDIKVEELKKKITDLENHIKSSRIVRAFPSINIHYHHKEKNK